MQPRGALLAAAAALLLLLAAPADATARPAAAAAPHAPSLGRRLLQGPYSTIMRTDIKADDSWYRPNIAPTTPQRQPGIIIVGTSPPPAPTDPSAEKKRIAKEAAYNTMRPMGWSAPELAEDVQAAQAAQNGAAVSYGDALERAPGGVGGPAAVAAAPARVSWVSFGWNGVDRFGRKRHH